MRKGGVVGVGYLCVLTERGKKKDILFRDIPKYINSKKGKVKPYGIKIANKNNRKKCWQLPGGAPSIEEDVDVAPV